MVCFLKSSILLSLRLGVYAGLSRLEVEWKLSLSIERYGC